MPRLNRLKEIGEYIYLTFTHRRLLLLIIVASSVVPGTFLYLLPLSIRLAYAYFFVSISMLSFFCFSHVFTGPAKQIFGTIIFGGRYKPKVYSTPKVNRLARKMGIAEKTKVYVTTNPWIKGPFTNMITRKVYIPESWLKNFPSKEILSIISHEFGHVKTRGRFSFELLLALGGTIASTLILGFFSNLFIVMVFEFALMMLLVTHISRRNEIRADLEGATGAGPEGLISVFEQLKNEAKRDEGSETHPPLKDRIQRLTKLLEPTQ